MHIPSSYSWFKSDLTKKATKTCFALQANEINRQWLTFQFYPYSLKMLEVGIVIINNNNLIKTTVLLCFLTSWIRCSAGPWYNTISLVETKDLELQN